LMRLNCPIASEDSAAVTFMEAWDKAGAQRGNDATPTPARHGLWIIDNVDAPLAIVPVPLLPGVAHGSYDAKSASYCDQQGALDTFILDSGRKAIITAARVHSPADGEEVSLADKLYHVVLEKDSGTECSSRPLEASSGKGCHVPIACCDGRLIYHYRNPVESGDLWSFDLSSGAGARLTTTMPRSIKQKLIMPTEVAIPSDSGAGKIQALLFAPEGSEKLQPLVWVHGGPMQQYSIDYNPLLSWLASLGYMVLCPNFAGSTGSGVEFMDKVFADGCGDADLRHCNDCAKWFKSSECASSHPRLDVSRGVAVGGHSWGGYVAYMCMVQGTDDFSCGIASAGITDWKIQQRGTEVRYYDYALMGGWVYDEKVAERAKKASPITHVANLKAPLLISHGEKDIDVPFSQIPAFVDAAKRSTHPNASVEYHSYAGEGHGISGTAAQVDVLQKMETFLRVNLKPWDFTDNPHGDLTAY